MISIDIGFLNYGQVFDHLVGRVERFGQEGVHNLNYFSSEVLESSKLWHFYFGYYSSQLLINQLHTLKSGTFQSRNLLFGEHFKGHLRNEQIRPERASVADGGLQILICERVEGVHLVERLVEDLVEDVAESTSSH